MIRHIVLTVALLTAASGGFAVAADPVIIVVGSDVSQTEHFAADELAKLLGKLFADVSVEIQSTVPDTAKQIILLGSPATNAAVGEAIGSKWPKIGDQGFVLQTVEQESIPTVVVGGGSPVATMWAAYELGHQLGVRYLLSGDLYPNTKPTLPLGNFSVAVEPAMLERAWELRYDLPIGPESWGLAEQKLLLLQLAKMKFNRVMIAVHPWQPFVDYECDKVKKQTAVLFRGETFLVDGDTAGKKAFKGKSVFTNPDFDGLATPDERTAAGVGHLRGVMHAAREVGMLVDLCVSPLEFPPEFKEVLPGSRSGLDGESLTVVPAPQDNNLMKLVSAKLSAYLKTYPDVDRLCLLLPTLPGWDVHADKVIERWTAEGVLDKAAIDELQLFASESGTTPVDWRSDLACLALLRELFTTTEILKGENGKPVSLAVGDVEATLWPILDRILANGTQVTLTLGENARSAAERSALLQRLPSTIRSQIIIPIADDDAGVLPQSALQSLGKLSQSVAQLKGRGFAVRYRMPIGMESSAYYLSRTAWDSELEPLQVHVELWTTTTGNAAAADRLGLAWENLEKATRLIGQNDRGFASPAPNMLMKHYIKDPIPDWWKPATDAYTQYLTEVYRSHGAIDGDAKPLLFSYAKRSEYVLEYLGAVKAVREAAIAKQAGDTEQAIEHLGQALEQCYNCINTLADVARDSSDRGLIAALNAYAYRPLLEELQRLEDAE